METNIEQTNKINLTSKEKSELLGEAILTVILLILLNIAILALAKIIIDGNSNLKAVVLELKDAIFNKGFNIKTYTLEKVAIFLLAIMDIIVLAWRLIRRYHQMQLRHIIKELHFIAEGNYDHRIPFKLNGDLGRIINNVNQLVNNTVTAMEEERRIEQSKDELITNISHDIRTPLTSIIGYLGLIEEGRYKSNEELLHYTHTAFKKSKQMKNLVDDLFEYTKVRQTNTKLNLIQFDLYQLLEQLAVDFELEAANKNMTLDVICHPIPFMMKGDTEKLVRVFDNLITNALKYGSDGNAIILSAEKTEEHALITIKNNGENIPEDAIESIFERFYRVDPSRSQETGGTGLGLAIAHSIISLHHGEISVKSENGWTSFVIRLPLTQEAFA
ncbi:sensor histidine kinase [Vagococcus xieshaowenii]|uniref:histidine kinase n=1 Tax=Vagococcus xieshaowenii TaxID=2562451 RepID=A0AAJ5JM37_9ENTE|nr:HAMP domain-containing sensor histidine kinase [Vagococcus xieshaowenii]QCA27860.1 GHKL domain-containing protein [Vagococcus xieshaowenii]TFZ42427.1 GHKL domain-containing protein [Vagococcus xieshaowenii]